MKFVTTDDVRQWYSEAADLAEFTRHLGVFRPDADDFERTVDIPYHLQRIIELRAKESSGPVPADAFDSIPFYSLCKGLFLPLAGLTPERVGQLFGIPWTQPTEDHASLLRRFFSKPIGLTFVQKLACVLGDPFLGRRSTFRRDSLISLLMSMRMVQRSKLLDRLTVLGDVAALFAESKDSVLPSQPMTSVEVLEGLRLLPGLRNNRKREILRSLYERTGKLESYFLTKLLLRNAGFGFEYQGPLLAQLLGEKFNAASELIEHAIALTDPFHVAQTLENEGSAGLRKIHLQPLSPIRPALASGSVDEIKKFPVWVERKYDGIRLLVHKSTDSRGAVLCGAYTRNRSDWLEMIPGMTQTIRTLPAQSAIVDGELFGMVVDVEGPRPASVYEVYSMLQGEPVRPVQLKYAAFDLLYLNGIDCTGQTLAERRQRLATLLAPLASWPTPIPVQISEGQMAQNKDDLNRLFHHFRAQGYEGIIAKDLAGAYHLATRDPSWVKRKPEITLDLVLLGGVYAVTSKEKAGLFGSYVIGAKTDDGGFDIVGDVAGLDADRDRHVQNEIVRLGLLTGQRIERASASGVRPGLAFRPAIVVTVKFEGVLRDQKTGKLSLRDPKIALIRSDKSAFEADDFLMIEKLYLDHRLS